MIINIHINGWYCAHQAAEIRRTGLAEMLIAAGSVIRIVTTVLHIFIHQRQNWTIVVRTQRIAAAFLYAAAVSPFTTTSPPRNRMLPRSDTFAACNRFCRHDQTTTSKRSKDSAMVDCHRFTAGDRAESGRLSLRQTMALSDPAIGL